MASKLPKSFMSTPEEDEFFEKEKAAAQADVEEVEAETEVEEEAAAEEATEEEVAEETVEEEAGEEESEEVPEEKPSRTVPIGALHEEREKRRQLQAKIEQMESTFQKMMERVAQQPQQLQQPVPQSAPEPQIPSYDEDPVAHLKARIDQLTQISTGTHQQIQQQNAMTKFVDALGTLENQMRAVTPDYDAAIDFAKRARDAELAALGYVPEARAEMMRQEILGTAAYCMQRGQNPVEAFYNYAKVRGWQGPNGAPKPAPAPAQVAKKLATVAKAQGAARSLPKGGSVTHTPKSLEDLAKLGDEDFHKYFESVMRKT